MIEIIVEEEMKGSDKLRYINLKIKLLHYRLPKLFQRTIFLIMKQIRGQSKEITPARINDLLTKNPKYLKKCIFKMIYLSMN